VWCVGGDLLAKRLGDSFEEGDLPPFSAEVELAAIGVLHHR
jgi:hypothetical protein